MHSSPLTIESLRSAVRKEKCGHVKSRGFRHIQYFLFLLTPEIGGIFC